MTVIWLLHPHLASCLGLSQPPRDVLGQPGCVCPRAATTELQACFSSPAWQQRSSCRHIRTHSLQSHLDVREDPASHGSSVWVSRRSLRHSAPRSCPVLGVVLAQMPHVEPLLGALCGRCPVAAGPWRCSHLLLSCLGPWSGRCGCLENPILSL